MNRIKYLTADAGIKIFYREAGSPGAPKLVLLHGFPSASHMFRDLMPLLADRFHVVAPDLPGFGRSDMPSDHHTFDRIAEAIDCFTEVIGFNRYAVYCFDYGAPTGFRLAVKHPERITAIISQNGSAYREASIMAYADAYRILMIVCLTAACLVPMMSKPAVSPGTSAPSH